MVQKLKEKTYFILSHKVTQFTFTLKKGIPFMMIENKKRASSARHVEESPPLDIPF